MGNSPSTNCIGHDGRMCSVATVHCSKMDIHMNIGKEIIDLRILDVGGSRPQRHNRKATQKIRGFHLNKNHLAERPMKEIASSATNSNTVQYPYPHTRPNFSLDLLPELE